jgi:HK97 family phage major capsid protein
MELHELKGAIEDGQAKLKAIRDRCQKEKRDPSPRERRQAMDLIERNGDLERELEELEQRQQQPANRPLTQMGDGQWDQKTGEFIPKDRGNEDMNNAEYRATSGPYKGRTMGSFFQDVAVAGTPEGRVDDRLGELRASGMYEGLMDAGGFAVPVDYLNVLLQKAQERAKLWPRVFAVPISGGSIKLPAIDETDRSSSRWGGIISYWKEEAAQYTGTKPKLRQLQLNPHKLTGLCYATEELLEDAPALETVIQNGFRSEFAWQVDKCILRGSGAGQPLGILNSGALITVNKETGQQAATIQTENILKMYARFSGERGIWCISRTTIPQLLTMGIVIGTGGSPLFTTGNGLNEPNRLLGLEVVEMEECSQLGTVGDIILVDPDLYILAEKGGVRGAVSAHVRFIYDELTYKFSAK